MCGLFKSMSCSRSMWSRWYASGWSNSATFRRIRGTRRVLFTRKIAVGKRKTGQITEGDKCRWVGSVLGMVADWKCSELTKQGKRHSQKFNIESSIYHISSVCLSYIVFFTALMRDAFDSQSVVFYPEIVFLFFKWKKYIKHATQCFVKRLNSSILVDTVRPIFNLLGVWRYVDTLSRVWRILY